jgi:TetR/AcrR family transcriptional regulator, mexJK operon transcriptional repressor
LSIKNHTIKFDFYGILKTELLMKKLAQNKKQKLERILKAALELFQSNGFINTSMDKIAEEAHVTKQTVYRYFESKESLFRAALEAQRLEGNSNFLKALTLEDPTQALETFAVGFIEKHLSEEHLANIRLLVSEGPKVPEITRTFYAMGPKRTKTCLARFFKDRFNIDNAEDEINIFLAILLSMRMPVLIGLHASPPREKIRRHATKAVKILMKMFDIERTGEI